MPAVYVRALAYVLLHMNYGLLTTMQFPPDTETIVYFKTATGQLLPRSFQRVVDVNIWPKPYSYTGLGECGGGVGLEVWSEI